MAGGEAPHLEGDAFGGGRSPGGIEAVHSPPEHLGNDLVVADRAGIMGSDRHAVAEDGDAIGDLADLGETMRDVDDETAARGDAPANPRSHSVSRGASADVASSRIRTVGSRASALATSTS